MGHVFNKTRADLLQSLLLFLYKLSGSSSQEKSESLVVILIEARKCCNVLQCVAVCCSVLQCVARFHPQCDTHVLQRVAMRCNALQCVLRRHPHHDIIALQRVVVGRSVLHCLLHEMRLQRLETAEAETHSYCRRVLFRLGMSLTVQNRCTPPS